jgi:hypothetical protein
MEGLPDRTHLRRICARRARNAAPHETRHMRTAVRVHTPSQSAPCVLALLRVLLGPKAARDNRQQRVVALVRRQEALLR